MSKPNNSNQTDNSQNTLSKVLHDTIHANVSSTTPLDNGITTLQVSATELATNQVARMLLDAAYEYGNTVPEGLTEEVLSNYLEWVTVNRIAYVQRMRSEMHPKDVVFPTIMFDYLSKIRNYDGSGIDGIMINVEMTQADRTTYVNEAGRIADFEDRQNIERWMKMAKIKVSTGLPMDRTTTDRAWFEMNVADSRVTTSSNTVPSLDEVFARCMVQFEGLANLFGVQKMELILVRAIEQALYDIVKRYVTDRSGKQ